MTSSPRIQTRKTVRPRDHGIHQQQQTSTTDNLEHKPTGTARWYAAFTLAHSYHTSSASIRHILFTCVNAPHIFVRRAFTLLCKKRSQCWFQDLRHWNISRLTDQLVTENQNPLTLESGLRSKAIATFVHRQMRTNTFQNQLQFDLDWSNNYWVANDQTWVLLTWIIKMSFNEAYVIGNWAKFNQNYRKC